MRQAIAAEDEDAAPTAPTRVPGSTVEEIDEAIQQLKESISILEDALERLKQGDQ